MSTKKINKTTAAQEKAAREARVAKPVAPRKSKAALEAVQAVDAITRHANAAEGTTPAPSDPRAAEILKAKNAGITLADNEFLSKPVNVPEGAKLKRIVRRNGIKLPFPVYAVSEPKPEPKKLSEVDAPKARKSSSPKPRAATANGEEKFYCGNLESPRVQEVLSQITKHTTERPLVAVKVFGKSQYPNRIARMLATKGLVVTERRDDVGVVFFGAAAK